MRMSMGGRLLVAGILVWALVGCGSAVEGEAEPLSGQAGLFDPCTDIPDSAIRGVGLDPYTKEVDIEGVEIPGWKICSWKGPWYFVVIFSNMHSLQDIRANTDFTGFHEVEIGQRQGVQYSSAQDQVGASCYFATQVKQGSIWLQISRMGLRPIEEPTCVLMQRYGLELETYWPS
ncbi:DUF3558 domain-containing protein [Rhodococcus sp. AD45-ID]|uniref:Uncharacterized protein DUF3558 n=2 Tax=Nocardiaceae TaxID=85025 RepID=A0A652YIN5_NOCGL|nr:MULTISPECIES: DUF3558 domain-containing protein [Rhodococcus]NMD64020.1 DUF3558 domain-containing protein [Nocardia globerula]KJF19543.1 hypothetical protein SZ00_05966 [Rhodococcus sp. AD45]MDV6269856.1 DUF3558 domain-containing protein [Rhodococcus globerulus]PSR39327.1 DUF3558 domain-containing protein [Rhodococcus sp. AD45-ID]PVX66716.1 uncharacterized protein DUF3558 [Rhodococcus globerulus]